MLALPEGVAGSKYSLQAHGCEAVSCQRHSGEAGSSASLLGRALDDLRQDLEPTLYHLVGLHDHGSLGRDSQERTTPNRWLEHLVAVLLGANQMQCTRQLLPSVLRTRPVTMACLPERDVHGDAGTRADSQTKAGASETIQAVVAEAHVPHA